VTESLEVNLRKAEIDDAARVAALITLAFRVEEFFVDGDRTNADAVRARMQQGAFLVGEDVNRALAGCVYVETRGNRGYFGMLSIDPERQGQGLGRQLVTTAEEHCRAAGCRVMEIEVVNLRTELPPFYRRLGYIEAGTRPFNQPDRAKLPCHFIVMTKELT
jgi:ribosomal protein S18 acetylase RimI-like enzyme